jgi:hypothetical protein
MVTVLAIVLAVVIIGLAGSAGFLFGKLTTPEQLLPERAEEFHDAQPPDEQTQAHVVLPEPPLYFFANLPPGVDDAAVREELAMAAGVGMRKFVVRVPLPWRDQPEELESIQSRMNLAASADSESRIVVHLDLNPPEWWLAEHPGARVAVSEPVFGLASVASSDWRAAVSAGLERVVEAIASGGYDTRVEGYLLTAMEDGWWMFRDGYGESDANTQGFREWLGRRYTNDQVLQEAWADETVTLDSATPPGRLDGDERDQVFFDLPSDQRYTHYLEYRSAVTADAIAEFSQILRDETRPGTRIIVPYGYALEWPGNDSGHLALGRLLEGTVDEFVSPVSYTNRALGGAGGFMGPVHSVLGRDKRWSLIDDSRTGITRDPVTGEISLMEGLRIQNVFEVQRRNFAMALANGLGMYWLDAGGVGSLLHQEMWRQFGEMRVAYQMVKSQSTPLQSDPEFEPISFKPTLCVVVDEESRFYQRCDTGLNPYLLTEARDVALRAGVPTEFRLLQDVLEGDAPPAAVYLFLNAFRITTEQREHLHALLSEQQAGAIWMYAPGYLSEEGPSAEHIGATVQMRVKQFEETESSSSAYTIDGNWIEADAAFGVDASWNPLFYIDDPDVDVLAAYQTSKKPSVAIAFPTPETMSVFCAEPRLPLELLREILSIREQHLYMPNAEAAFADTTYFGGNVVALHAQGRGQRHIDLGLSYDVRDLLDDEVGWPGAQVITPILKTGDTRLLYLTPAITEPDTAITEGP